LRDPRIRELRWIIAAKSKPREKGGGEALVRVTVWVSFAILFPVVPDVLSGETTPLYTYDQVRRE
jgi:hypothetical protein